MDEHARWLDRDLSAKQYVYFWADGIFQARLEDDAQCLLVIIGATLLCTQHRCARVFGHALSIARPRRLRSRRSSFHTQSLK